MMKEKKQESIGKIYNSNTKLEHYPTGWLMYAHELKKTEELIYMDILKDWDTTQIEHMTKQFKPHPLTPTKVHFLIIGLAIENLLKCLYLDKHPEIIKSGRIEDNLFKSHNLLQIATQKLELKINEDEKFILELSTKAVKWYGRYPIPLQEKETFFGIETNRTKIHVAFHTLFSRLVALVNEEQHKES